MTITIPETPDQLVESLNDTKLLPQILKNGQLGDFTKAYAEKFAKADKGDVDAQIAEQASATAAEVVTAKLSEEVPAAVQAAMAEYLKDNPAPQAPAAAMASAAGLRAGGARDALYRQDARGAKADGIFNGLGEFGQAISVHSSVSVAHTGKLAKLTEIQNAYGSEVPADGGFLIPENLRSQILQMAIENAVIRPRCTVIPMDSLRVPIPIIDDTSHVSSILGGVIAYWTEENTALTASQAAFGRVVLDAKKLTAYAEVPNELLQDAPAFTGFLAQSFPLALAWFEDIAFFNGTGVGEPLGIVNCPVSINQAKQASQAAKTIVWENIVFMYSRMLPASLGRAVWICNLDTFPELATMAVAVGTGGNPVWVGSFNPADTGAYTPPVTILGRPVIFTEKVPTLGTPGDIIFADLGYYLLGDRMQMQASSSIHYKFANDVTAFRVIERCDGRPWLQTPLTPHSGSANTLTPFVQLATR